MSPVSTDIKVWEDVFQKATGKDPDELGLDFSVFLDNRSTDQPNEFYTFKERIDGNVADTVAQATKVAPSKAGDRGFQDMVRRYMVEGRDGITDDEFKQIRNAQDLQVLPRDLENRAFENLFQNADELAQFQHEKDKARNGVEALGWDIIKSLTGSDETADVLVKIFKENAEEERTGIFAAADATDAILEAIGFDEEHLQRNPEDFINWASPEDRKKFEAADVGEKFKLIMGTLGGYADALVRNVMEFPTKGMIELAQAGRPVDEKGKLLPEKPWDKSKRVFNNAVQIMKPLANWWTLMGWNGQAPIGSRGHQQALEEFYEDPLIHTLFLFHGLKRGIGKYDRAKQRQFTAQGEEVRFQERMSETQEKLKVAEEKVTQFKEAKEAARIKGEETLQRKKPEVPVEDVDLPTLEEFRTKRRLKFQKEMKELQPEVTREKLDAQTRYHYQYFLTGGRKAVYPKYRKTARGPVRAGLLEGAEAEYMITGGEAGSPPIYPVQVGPRLEYPYPVPQTGGKPTIRPLGEILKLEQAQIDIAAGKRTPIPQIPEEKPVGKAPAAEELKLEAKPVTIAEVEPPKVTRPELTPIETKTPIKVEGKPQKVIREEPSQIIVETDAGETRAVSKLDVQKQNPKAPELESYKSGREVIIPQEELSLDVERFQPRETDFASRTAESIASSKDPRKLLNDMDAVVAWTDPKNGKKYIISGHSRHAGLKALGENDVPVRFFNGTETEAVQYAHGLANEGATPLSVREKIGSYRTLKGTGMDKEQLSSTFGTREAPRLEAMQNLDTHGKFMEYLSGSTLEGGTPFISKWGKMVGELKEAYRDKMTNFHENEIFEFLYQDKKPNYNMKVDELKTTLQNSLSDKEFTKETPLGLQKRIYGEAGRADTGPIVAEIERLKGEIAGSKNIRNKAETVEEMNAQQKLIDEATAEITRLKGGINEFVEKQVDIFAKEGKTAEIEKPRSKVEAAEMPTPVETGNYMADVQRNIGHHTTALEEGLEFKKTLTDPKRIEQYQEYIDRIRTELGEFTRERDRIQDIAGEPGFKDKLNKMAEDAKGRLKDLGQEDINNLNMAIDPVRAGRVIKELTTIGAAELGKIALKAGENFKEWSKVMLDKYGKDLKPHLESLWERVQRTRRHWSAEFRARRWEQERKYIDEVRYTKLRTHRVNERTRAWDREYTETERADAGAIIEGIDNITTGEPPTRNARTLKLAKEYKHWQEIERQGINDYLAQTAKDEYIAYLEYYLPHFYKGSGSKIKGAIHSKLIHSPNAKARKLPTLQDALDAGLTPISQDVSFLHRTWGDINWTVALNRKVADMIKTAVDDHGAPLSSTAAMGLDWEKFDTYALKRAWATQGEPTFSVVKEKGGRSIRNFDRRNDALDFLDQNPNKGYQLDKRKGPLSVRDRGIYLSPELQRMAHMAFDNPYANRGSIGRTYDWLNSHAKAAWLSLSGFHFGSLFESAFAVLGGTEVKNVLKGRPGFVQGKSLQKLRPEITEDAILHGLEIGESAKSDYGYHLVNRSLRGMEAATRSTPFVGRTTKLLRQGYEGIQKALWENVHEGYKIYSYEKLTSEVLKELPADVPPDIVKQVKVEIANMLNDAFGGQEWESHLWMKPQMMLYARRTLLAPDWTTSNARIAGMNIAETVKNPRRRKLLIRYWRNMALTLTAGTVAMNYINSGHGPWENEYGHKTHIDVTRTVKIGKQLYSKVTGGDYDIDADQQRYYAKLGKQAREVAHWVTEPVGQLGRKAGPMTRQIWAQAGGTELGGWDMEWKKEDLNAWKNLSARAKEVTNMFVPFSFSGNQFMMTFPMMKGATPYKGIKMYQDAIESPEWYIAGEPVMREESIRAINDALVLNGHDGEKVFKIALGGVRHKYYEAFHEALEEQDFETAEEAAVKLTGLGSLWQDMEHSLLGRGATFREIMEAEKHWRFDKQLYGPGIYERIIGYDQIIKQDIEKLKKHFNGGKRDGG